MYKGGGRYPELILSLKKLNGVGILDQELGVAVRDLKDFFFRRYDPKIISSIDRHFLGKRYLEAAKKYSDIPVFKMLITAAESRYMAQQENLARSSRKFEK